MCSFAEEKRSGLQSEVMLSCYVSLCPGSDLSRLAQFFWCFNFLLLEEIYVSSVSNYLFLKLVSEKLLHSDWRQKAVLILKEMHRFSRRDRLLKSWKW